jgi:hypothetical protein
MTRQAEKDIRSALRQLRGARGRLEMARTGRLSPALQRLLDAALADAHRLEADLVRMLRGDGQR